MTADLREISTETIDHAFWRAAQLVGVVAGVLLIASLVGLFLIRSMVVRVLRQTAAAKSP